MTTTNRDPGGAATDPLEASGPVGRVAWARSARRSPRPPVFRRRQGISVAVFLLAAGLIIPQLVSGNSAKSQVNFWLLYSVVAIGFYLVFSLSGQFAFCQAFMMGLGAYVSAWVTEGLPFWVGLVSAVVVVSIVAVLFALLVHRADHFYFAMATLGLSEIGLLVVRKWSALGGTDGQRVRVDPVSLFGYQFKTQSQVFWLLLGALGLALVLTALIERSPLRREAIAVRDLPQVAETAGLPTIKIRVLMFTLGSAFAAVGGSLYVHWQRVASTEAFGLDLGIGLFLMVMLGGSGSMWGAVIGAAFYVFVPDQLSLFSEYREFVYGGLLLFVVLVLPDGLVGIFAKIREVTMDVVSRRWGSGPTPAPDPATSTGGAA